MIVPVALLTLIWLEFFLIRPSPVTVVGLIGTLTLGVFMVIARLERRRHG